MNAAHTPGPWHVIHEWNVSGPEYEVANGSILVCDDAESRANANLIAAAPELLAFVESLVSAMDAPATLQKSLIDARLPFAREIIAKARGQ
jgi:hypothetical protein